MHFRVAVNLAGRRLQDLRLGALRQSQHVDRAVNAGLGGLHGVELVVDRRGRAREVVDLVDLEIQRKRHVVADHLEVRVRVERGEVVARAREEVVDADDVVAPLEQALAQVGAEEPGAAGDQNAFTHEIAHVCLDRDSERMRREAR